MAKDQWEVVSRTPIQSSKSPWEVVSVTPIGEEDRKKKEEEERKKQGIASILPEDPFKPTRLDRDTRYGTADGSGYDYKKGEINELKTLMRNRAVERDPKKRREGNFFSSSLLRPWFLILLSPALSCVFMLGPRTCFSPLLT